MTRNKQSTQIVSSCEYLNGLKGFFLCLSLLISSAIFGQYYPNFNDSLDVKKTRFSWSNQAFLINEEVFSVPDVGYTSLGSQSRFRIIHKMNAQLQLGIGLNAQYYFGDASVSELRPLLQIIYRPSKQHTLYFGEINNHAQRANPEYLIARDRYLLAPEMGFEYSIAYDRIQSDLWIDWRNHIVTNDTEKERFIVGNHLSISLLSEENVNLNMGYHLIFYHQGGQRDISDDGVINNWSFAPFIEIRQKSWHGRFQYVLSQLDNHTINETDNGNALSVLAGYEHNHWNWNLMYWHATDYKNIIGEELYQGMNAKNMLRYNCEYANQISQDLKISGLGTIYHTLSDHSIDYIIECRLLFDIGKTF